ncbi:MAG: YggS family pyridoxal phosphate-dependent enzyme [Solirubrobacteraceae bacterium]
MARVELIRPRPDRVRSNLQEVRAEIARAAGRAGRDPEEVTLVAATKYIASDDLPVLAQAGVRLVGENRAQDLVQKAAVHGDLFQWDFIGALQSRRVASMVPLVRRIHSLASVSAAEALARCLTGREDGSEPPGAPPVRDDFGVLVQVNVAREPGKAGIAPEELADLVACVPVAVRGLMTMPPAVSDAQQSRVWFAALRELAHAHGLSELSMGTSQDFAVAVEEGATSVRIGARLYL